MRHAVTAPSLHPGAQRGPGSPQDEKSRLEQAKDKLGGFFQRPSSGRTSALGRKVEKPGPTTTGGPSGQTDSAQHDRRHTND